MIQTSEELAMKRLVLRQRDLANSIDQSDLRAEQIGDDGRALADGLHNRRLNVPA